MLITKIEIENFRSIYKTIHIHADDSSVIAFVGPNNVGKSNILRAINLFFNKTVEPDQPFNPDIDICKHSQKAARIQMTLQLNKAKDRLITKFIDQKYRNEFKDYAVPITLRYFRNGNYQYSFTNSIGQKKGIDDLLERILEYVNCVYIPSIKDYKTIINSQMMRKIVKATFQGWGRGIVMGKTLGENKEKFQTSLQDIQKILDSSGDYVSKIITSVIPSIERFSFSLPYDNLEEFLGKLIFQIKELELAEDLNLDNEGSGIQSFTIYSMLRLLHELRPRNTYRDSEFVWLIEEPETFMHHDLQRNTFEKLKEYAKDGHIFITTHSPVFIDKRNFKNSFHVRKDPYTQIRPVTTTTAMEVIGGSLGVSFQDFLMFKRYNLLVEGDSDKELLIGLNKIFQDTGDSKVIDFNTTEIISCRSANAIVHFYDLYNVFSKYATFFALFDRDQAGIKAREELTHKKYDSKYLLLIPDSIYKKQNSIEDLVEKDIWDKCLSHLDNKGLITIKIRQDVKIGYEFLQKDREKVKNEFVQQLLKYAKFNVNKFGKYRVLINKIHDLIYEVANKVAELMSIVV